MAFRGINVKCVIVVAIGHFRITVAKNDTGKPRIFRVVTRKCRDINVAEPMRRNGLAEFLFGATTKDIVELALSEFCPIARDPQSIGFDMFCFA